jgi:tetratricopeptide (TPR) repeat protein
MTLAGVLPLVLALLLQLPGDLGGSPDDAYLVSRQFTSPVTGERFVSKVLKRDVPAANFDYDRCPHPPVNTLAYTIVIDPVSGYVAYPENFEKPVAWTKEDLARILGLPKFKRDTPEGMPWFGAYPWERFENGALLAQAASRSSTEVADYWLLAAWSVRLDVVSGHNEFDSEVADVFKPLPRRAADPGDLVTLYELQLAKSWQALRSQGQLSEMPAADFNLALGWLYRSRGELVGARHYLDEALAADAQVESHLLYRYLDSSLKLEQNYLRSAKTMYAKAWADGEVNGPSTAWTAFLIGEVSRRLGELDDARNWFTQALSVNKGTLNNDLVKHQQKLLENGLGY